MQQHLQGALKIYIDFHAHAGKRGGFIFGNSLRGSQQIENILFAKLVAMNSINFDFAECTFTEESMTVKDKRDGLSREGAGRVAIHKDTGLPNCYTLECNYHSGKRLNYIPQKLDLRTHQTVAETPITDVRSKMYEGKKPPAYTPELFEDIGRAVGFGLLDYFEKSVISRVPMSTYKSIETMRKEIGCNRTYMGTTSKRSEVLSERMATKPKKLCSKATKGNKQKGPDIVFVSKKQKENGKQEIQEDVMANSDESDITQEEAKTST